MIAIVDYGLGNIKAFANVFKKSNIAYLIAKNSEDIKVAEKILLPGVGAFDYAMERLNNSGMRQALDDVVLNSKIPVLGVCVGMQMMANSSEEGSLKGLGWIDGEVLKFDESKLLQSTRLPHMGWNDVSPVTASSLFTGLEKEARFYFLHSYYIKCNKKEDVLAGSDYGGEFTCAVNHENIYGVQFHPEKSHQWGIGLLRNFALM